MAEKSFSERMGLKAAKPVQGQSMDADLRVCLWNAIMKYRHMLEVSNYERAPSFRDNLLREIWGRHLKLPLDRISVVGQHRLHEQVCWEHIGKWYFHDSQKWHGIYEFVEFIGRFEMSVSTHDMLSDKVDPIV